MINYVLGNKNMTNAEKLDAIFNVAKKLEVVLIPRTDYEAILEELEELRAGLRIAKNKAEELEELLNNTKPSYIGIRLAIAAIGISIGSLLLIALFATLQ